jgi:hypothetical protein
MTTECPLCSGELSDEELSYVESFEDDQQICFCQAAKSLVQKDEEIARLKALCAEIERDRIAMLKEKDVEIAKLAENANMLLLNPKVVD